MSERKNRWSFKFWLFCIGVACFLGAGLNHYLAQKQWLPIGYGKDSLFWLLVIGSVCIFATFLLWYVGRRDSDGERHWKRKSILLGVFFLVSGVAMFFSGNIREEICIALICLAALLITIPIVGSGLGIGFDSVTGRKKKIRIARHAREGTPTVSGVFAQTDDEDDKDRTGRVPGYDR